MPTCAVLTSHCTCNCNACISRLKAMRMSNQLQAESRGMLSFPHHIERFYRCSNM